jgi:hypothetical protein
MVAACTNSSTKALPSSFGNFLIELTARNSVERDYEMPNSRPRGHGSPQMLEQDPHANRDEN